MRDHHVFVPYLLLYIYALPSSHSYVSCFGKRKTTRRLPWGGRSNAVHMFDYTTTPGAFHSCFVDFPKETDK